MPPLEPIPTPIFNTGEQEFLNKTEKLLGTGNNWESHVAQQILLPRMSSPTHIDKQLGSLEQLEVDTGDNMDIRDFSGRPANDMRPPKPPRKIKEYIMDIIPPPGCPNYMAMNHAVMGMPKLPLPEIRSLIIEKRKVLIRWPACLKRSPPKATFNNNDIYAKGTKNGENFYKEPQESKTNEEEHEPKEKNMKIFYKLNINDNTNIASTLHEEEFSDQNYEAIKDCEIAL